MNFKSFVRSACLLLFLYLGFGYRISAEIITYPTPPGLVTSPDFTIKANNIPIWVEKIGSKLKTFDYTIGLSGGREMEDLNAAGFSFSGKVTITITASADIESYIIRPKSKNIAAVVKGHDITFTIDKPVKLYIEINKLAHLALFADPIEVSPPKKGDQGVIYFGPGTYNPGEIDLKSNQTVYIAGGAAVNANIRGKNLKNVVITGRGILQGNIKISGTTNLNVSGIFIRNTKGWTNTLTDCHKSSYRNVKVFGYEAIYSVDGIDPVSCTDFTIDDCFMRCRDDCVSIKSGDYKLMVDSVSVTNSVMVGWSCSDGVTLGFELNGGPVENVVVRNCDILYARGDGMTKGHSGFGIVCDGPALVRNIRFEDIRVEEQVEFKNLEIVVTNGTIYGNDPPGHVKGVYLKNIRWENTDKPFIIRGFSAGNLVEDITFDHCSVGGKVLTDTSDAVFHTNEFAHNIKFIH